MRKKLEHNVNRTIFGGTPDTIIDFYGKKWIHDSDDGIWEYNGVCSFSDSEDESNNSCENSYECISDEEMDKFICQEFKTSLHISDNECSKLLKNVMNTDNGSINIKDEIQRYKNLYIL